MQNLPNIMAKNSIVPIVLEFDFIRKFYESVLYLIRNVMDNLFIMSKELLPQEFKNGKINGPDSLAFGDSIPDGVNICNPVHIYEKFIYEF